MFILLTSELSEETDLTYRLMTFWIQFRMWNIHTELEIFTITDARLYDDLASKKVLIFQFF